MRRAIVIFSVVLLVGLTVYAIPGCGNGTETAKRPRKIRIERPEHQMSAPTADAASGDPATSKRVLAPTSKPTEPMPAEEPAAKPAPKPDVTATVAPKPEPAPMPEPARPGPEKPSKPDSGDAPVEATRPDTVAPKPKPASTTAPPSGTEPWGDLTVRFVYDGDAPQHQPIRPDKDQAVCGQIPLIDESLIVNQENGGVANVLMWLYVFGDAKPPTPHPSYKDAAQEPVVLDNKNCRFEPHVCVVQVGQPFHVKNSDPIGHNTKFDLFKNNISSNVQIAAGETEQLGSFLFAETVPAPVNCNVHGWMSAQLLVVDNPYFAASDKDGNVLIKNLPVGEWTFCIHQQEMGYGQDLNLGGKKSSRRGTVNITIHSGENDLGDVVISPSRFTD